MKRTSPNRQKEGVHTEEKNGKKRPLGNADFQ